MLPLKRQKRSRLRGEWKEEFEEQLQRSLEDSFGAIIRALPKEGSITPTRLSKLVGLHPRTIKRLLRTMLYLQSAPKLRVDQSLGFFQVSRVQPPKRKGSLQHEEISE